MKTIDERVVEMRFDNKQFEEGTKKTLSTIQRLKEALKFSESSKSLQALEKTANNIKLDGMVSSVRALEKRFSTLGIVGMRVIQNLTDTMMNRFAYAVDYVQDSIVSGGIRRSMNIENAHFQLQALLKDEEKVQAVMDNAMESVDGTAYAYDEAAKAASMFSASGIEAGEDMMRALKGVVGVAAMTNSEYQSISEIFTTVAGNGRLMGDQLLQLSSRGLNAAATVADFFNKVNDGTADTSDSIKESIASLTEGVTVSEKEIREWVSGGEISFQIFAEAMNEAFGESAERANETFTGALSNIKSALARIGAEFTSPLVVQNGALVELFNTVRLRVNDLKKELTFDEEQGNVNALSKQFTDSVIAMAKSANTFVKDADISAPVKMLYNNVETIKNLLRGLSSVFPPIGKAFSKTFSDFKIDNLVELSEYLSKITERFRLTKEGSILVERIFKRLFTVVGLLIDGFEELSPSILKIGYTTKTLRILYRLLRSFINVGGNFITVLKAIGKGFSNAFVGLDTNPLESFLVLLRNASNVLVKFTERIRFSEESAKNLEDGFTGIFSILKLLVDGFLALLSAVAPIERPMTSIGSVVLALFGAIGRTMTSFAEWAKQSTVVNASFSLLLKGITAIIEALGDLIKWIDTTTDGFTNFGIVGKIFNTIGIGIKNGITYASPFVEEMIQKVFGLKEGLLSLSADDVVSGIEFIGSLFAEFGRNMMQIDLSNPSSIIESFKEAIKGVIDLARTNPGFDAFVTNITEFIDNVRNGLSSENVSSKVEGVRSGLSSFINWVKENFLPMMQNLSAGDALAAGMSFTGIYSFLKAVKAFNSIGDAAGKFEEVLMKIGDVLDSYQKNIQATTLLKIAGAIGILALSLVALSFTDTERMLKGAAALALVGGVIVSAMFILAKRKSDADKAKQTVKTVDLTTSLLSSAVNNFIKKQKTSSIKGMILSIGTTVGLIAASIAGLANTYKKNEEGFKNAAGIIMAISGVFGTLMLATTILSAVLKGDGSVFLNTAKAIRQMATSILVTVVALQKVFKLDFPTDWELKLGILAAIFTALTAVAIVLTLIGRIGGGNEGPGKTVLMLVVSLLPMISALNKLFKMELPTDWEVKLGILGMILAALSATMLVIGIAARLSKGNMKAGGTISGMAVFITSIVTALSVLSLIKEDKLMSAVKSIGIILVALAVSLSQAAKISDEGSGKSVKAMASVITAITGSLGILSLISWDKLKVGVAALDAVLLALAVTFREIGKIKNDKAYLTVFSMVMMTVTIAYMLYKLAEQPWDALLSAGISLGAVLLSMSYAYKAINNADDVNIKDVGKFLALTLAVVPIAAALYVLSDQPWDGMLAAGASLGLTVLAFAKAFQIISKSESVDLKSVASFLALTLAVVPIAAALYVLSDQPWDGLIASATSLSLTLLALSAVSYILSKIGEGGGGSVKAALYGIAILDLLIADLALVLVGLGALFQNESVKTFLTNGVDVFGELGRAIGKFIGGIVGGFIGGAATGLEDVGKSMSIFMENAKPFFDGIEAIDPSIMESVKLLAESLLILMGADVIGRFAGKDTLKQFSDQLPDFGSKIKEFAQNVTGVNPEAVEGAASAAKIISEVAKNLPYSMDSLMGKMFGKKSLKDFADELNSFAPAIVDFAEQVKDVKPEAVEGAASAATLMSKFANGLNYSYDSFAGKLFGKKSLTSFGNELKLFGPSITAFAEQVKDVKPEAVEGAAAAGEIMAVLATKLPYSDGTFMAKVFGKKSLATFGAELEKFGPKIKSFVSSITGIKPEAVEGASAVADTFATIANALPSSGGIVSLFSGDKSINKFGDKLVLFGQKFKVFCETMEEIETSSVSSTTAKISDLVEVLRNAGEEGVTEFINAFNKKEGELSKAIANVINFAVDVLKNNNSSFEKEGKNSMSSYVYGMSKSGNDVSETTKTVVNHAVAAANSVKEDMRIAGENAAQGFIDGITNKQLDAETAGRNLGLAAYNAAREALDEHSPSRKMGTVGAFAALGMINEMLKAVPDAYDAGKELGLSAIDGATDGTSQLVNYIDSNWNLDPVITPRVDLSELQSSGSQINRMFNESVYSVRANAMSVNNAMGNYRRISTEDGIMELVDGLKEAISDMGSGDTYTINGMNYTEGSDVAEAIKTLIRATNVKRRV